MREGKLTPEEAEVHPQRSIITRALGPEPEVEVERMTYPGARRRRLPDLLGRPDGDGPRGRRRGDPARPLVARAGGRRSWSRRQRGRRPRQHHRRPVPARRGGRGRGRTHGATMVAGDTESLRSEDVQAAVAAAAEREPETGARTRRWSSTTSRRASCARRARPGRPTAAPRRTRCAAGSRPRVVTLVVRRRRRRLLGRQPPVLLRRDRRPRPRRALPRPALRAAARASSSGTSEYSTAVPARLLPESRRDRVLDHRLRSKGDAADLIKQVERGELED